MIAEVVLTQTGAGQHVMIVTDACICGYLLDGTCDGKVGMKPCYEANLKARSWNL